MKSIILCFVLSFTVTNVALAAKSSATRRVQQLSSLRQLSKYAGTYPCENGLLQQRILLQSLRNILGHDYGAYREHMKLSGCGAIRRVDGFLLLDVSQLHVGGYQSMMFVRESDGALYLFWLKSAVWDKDYEFYGPRPIPAEVSRAVESELNEGWGHVAQFTVRGEHVDIRLNH